MCNITIYFCNIHMKHLQHTSETYEKTETYSCNMRFQRYISAECMKARWCVVFTRGSGSAAVLVGGCRRQWLRLGGPAAVRSEAAGERIRAIERVMSENE
jgi:hypothetical protein